MPLDPNVPPHKTKPFWFIVALAVLVSVGYPLAAPSHGPILLDVVPSILTFAMMVCVGWFAVRRAQRGHTGRSSTFYIVLLTLAAIFFILGLIFKRHP